ncbi:MAG TPA: MerC domain-containing protein [Ohtaekwangia sp.]|nr:MerC domain-containing protein [Ohtaekwangia sp.]
MIKIHRAFSWQHIFDKAGMWTSGLCAVHCIAIPFFLSMSAFSSMVFLHNENIENMVLVVSAMIGVGSLGNSFIKLHKRWLPLIVLFIGLCLIVLSRLELNVSEPIFASSGASLMASAHFLNIRYCKKFGSQCECC